jgi:hypothetical protein
MKASELIERLYKAIENHGDFTVSVMQETRIPGGGVMQTQSVVTDVAVATEEIVIIGQELLG